MSTLGFHNAGDIAAQSVYPTGACTVGYGVILSADLWNLSCPVGQSGNVDFYWVVGASKQFIGNAFATDTSQDILIPPGSFLTATILWTPTSIGRGQILCESHSDADGTCPKFDAPNDQNPYSQYSATIRVYAPTTQAFLKQLEHNSKPYARNGLSVGAISGQLGG